MSRINTRDIRAEIEKLIGCLFPDSTDSKKRIDRIMRSIEDEIAGCVPLPAARKSKPGKENTGLVPLPDRAGGASMAFIDSLDGLVYRADPETFRATYVNGAVRNIYGVGAEEWIRKPELWESAIHPGDRDRIFSELKAARNRRENVILTYRIVRKGKSVLWVEDHVSWEKDKRGRALAVNGVMYNITRKKAAEEQLRESESKFRQISENVNEIFWLRDVCNDRVIYVNPVYEKIFGLTCDSLYKNPLSFLKVVCPDDRGLFKKAKVKHRRNAEYTMEYRIKRPDGSIRWIRSHRSPIRDESGEVYRIAGVATDITEDKISKELLAEAEEKYRSIFEGATGGFYRSTPEGVFTEVNPAFAHILGYDSPAELKSAVTDIGRNVYLDPQIRDECIQAVYEKGSACFEIQVRRKDGSTAWVSNKVRIVPDDKGAVAFFEGFVEDISERRSAEGKLKESQRFVEKIVGTSPCMLYVYDVEQTKNVYVNRAVEEILNYTKAEILGIGSDLFPWIIHPEDITRVTRHHEELGALREGQVKEIEYRMRRKAGGWRWLRSRDTVFSRTEQGALKEILGSAEDITESKWAEDRLQESRQLLEKTFANLAEAVFIIDFQTERILNCNAAASRIFGYSREEMIGNEAEFLHLSVGHLEAFRSQLKRAILEKGVFKLTDWQMKHKNGGIVPTEHSVVQLLNDRGEPSAWVSVIRDVTGQKRAEALYRIVTEKSFAGTYVIRDGYILYNNDRAFYYTGYTAEELRGRKAARIVHPEDREKARRDAIDMLKGKRTAPYEYRIITKEGSIRWILEIVSPIDFEGTRAVLGNFMDITESKEAIRKLEEHVNMESSILEAIPHAVIGIHNRQIIFANNSAVSVFGFSPEELIGKSTRILYRSDEEYERIGESVYGTLQQQRHHTLELVCRHKDGRDVFCEFNSAIIGNDINDKHIVAVYEDITARKRSEEEKKSLEAKLGQAQKMEAIGTLAGGIAHDFNNMLGAMLGNIEMTMSDLKEDTHVLRYLKRSMLAGERAKELVKQILTFSRQGERELNPLIVNLIVKEAMQLLRSALPTTIEIRQDIASEQYIITADPTQIHQIIMNLCTNATHAMRESGGVLEVRLYHRHVGPDAPIHHANLIPGTYLELKVKDTGHGIDPKILDRIFDPFFTTKRAGEGTGMGLAMVHGIVKSCGGDIVVESELGKGTTFFVYLPLIQKQEGFSPEAELMEPVPQGQEHILFIDDEEGLIQVAEDMLSSLGYKVITHSNSMEALRIFRARPDLFDLVITDMTMPNMTGLELAKEILAEKPEMPIILCTGFSESITAENVKSAGIRELVMKPISRRRIAQLIRRVLDGPEPENKIFPP